MSKKIKIGLILSNFPGYSETFILNKISGLIDEGFDVNLFLLNKSDLKFSNNSVKVYSQINTNNYFLILVKLILLFLFHPRICIKFVKLEKSCNRDLITSIKGLIVNSHMLSKKVDWIHFVFATLSIGRENVAQSINAKLAVSLRGYDIGIYPYNHPDCYRLLWDKVDKIHTISDDLYNKAIQFGLKKDIIFQKINPAINSEFFNSTFINSLNVPIRILTVSRLEWKKGYEYVLHALYLLKKENIKFIYNIVGDGKDKEKIIYLINYYDLVEEVELNGKLSIEGVKKKMEWADIYIQPSIQEGFCNAVLEAQSMGLICIVTNAEGLSENVIHKETGWVVNKRSSLAIKRRIIKILNTNPLEYEKIRRSAISRIRNKFHLIDQKLDWKRFYLE